MSTVEIHVTSAGDFQPVAQKGLNGLFQVQIVGTVSGTITLQSRNRSNAPTGSNQAYSSFVDPTTGDAITFTSASIFDLWINGEINVHVVGGSGHDFYVLFNEIKTNKI